MLPANDMLEIAKEVNLNKLDRQLEKVTRKIHKKAKRGHTEMLIHFRELGASEYLRDMVRDNLWDNGYKVELWNNTRCYEVSWR